jgi:hypothetical protein
MRNSCLLSEPAPDGRGGAIANLADSFVGNIPLGVKATGRGAIVPAKGAMGYRFVRVLVGCDRAATVPLLGRECESRDTQKDNGKRGFHLSRLCSVPEFF